MVARAEELHLYEHPIRRLLRPALGIAVLAALVALIRRKAREPHVSPMSDQWLSSHAHDWNRFDH